MLHNEGKITPNGQLNSKMSTLLRSVFYDVKKHHFFEKRILKALQIELSNSKLINEAKRKMFN